MTRTANDQFIATCLEIDNLLDEIKALRSDHFGTDAEKTDWGNVGSAGYVRDRLREAVNFLNGKG